MPQSFRMPSLTEFAQRRIVVVKSSLEASLTTDLHIRSVLGNDQSKSAQIDSKTVEEFKDCADFSNCLHDFGAGSECLHNILC
ncbi:hypothetical protein DSM3645_30136 [Blastopirellula marina DSM 3645]|uniref:Uncharacterized protein n=1 Tax=Blastopirellula marina DSM 3645 TaxID=314230 RepID=A3ZXB6_9BACT|nr:hypothetical protein DSM3645_30136 [Blastopirellula marina DSM 3645]